LETAPLLGLLGEHRQLLSEEGVVLEEGGELGSGLPRKRVDVVAPRRGDLGHLPLELAGIGRFLPLEQRHGLLHSGKAILRTAERVLQTGQPEECAHALHRLTAARRQG
jgi:hypothetical protein